MQKRLILYPALFTAFVAGAAIFMFFGKDNAFAQARQLTALASPRTADDAAASGANAEFRTTARKNAALGVSLVWTFSGKRQKGWEIYAPLIANTIGSVSPYDSPEFAAAIARWQTKNALIPSGILDEATLRTLIKYWQSQRLGSSASIAGGILFSAPISDFYDQSRDRELLKVERNSYAALQRLLSAAAKDLGRTAASKLSGNSQDERCLKIISAYRSPAYQEALRRKEPYAGRGALARVSAHSTGRAFDLYVGGDPVSTKDVNRLVQIKTPAYRWLVRNAGKFGFVPYFYEPWHWEFAARN